MYICVYILCIYVCNVFINYRYEIMGSKDSDIVDFVLPVYLKEKKYVAF